MNHGLPNELRSELSRLDAGGLTRKLEPVGAKTLGAEAPPTDFASNDYLGLARHAEVIEASREALLLYGAGARASRLLGGGSPLEALAEQEMAAWLGGEAALLFPTGFQQ